MAEIAGVLLALLLLWTIFPIMARFAGVVLVCRRSRRGYEP